MAQIKEYNGEQSTYINKKMLVSLVSLAAKEIQGVIDIYHSKRLSFKSLFNKNIGKGVTIKYTKIGVLIDVYVIVSTDSEVNDIVYRIQQNVMNSIKSLLPMQIKAINVHIMDAEKHLSNK